MTAVLRLLLSMWLTVSLVACTSMQPLRDTRPTTVRQEIHAGDEIEVTNREGQTYNLKVTKIDDTFLYGTTEKLTVKMPLKAITRLKVGKANDKGVAIAAVTALVIGVVVVGVVLVRAINRGISNAFDGG